MLHICFSIFEKSPEGFTCYICMTGICNISSDEFMKMKQELRPMPSEFEMSFLYTLHLTKDVMQRHYLLLQLYTSVDDVIQASRKSPAVPVFYGLF